MTDSEVQKPGKRYDLEERTGRFGENVIAFAKTIQKDSITEPLIVQLIRSATSVGADYCEADDAIPKREFRKFIGICRREARECKHWFRMIVAAAPSTKNEARRLWQEAKELHLIFAKTFTSLSKPS